VPELQLDTKAEEKDMKHSILAFTTLLILACGASSDTGINKSLFVADGEHKSNGLRSVNGSISVGNEATVDGNCSTVNGEITIGENAEVGELSCVNGAIKVDRNTRTQEISCVNGSIDLNSEVKADGDVSTVNGAIRSRRETMIAGDMSTVNGDMSTLQSLIVGDISTVNGDISLYDKTTVKGNIVIDRDGKRPKDKTFKLLTVRIDGASKVNGDINVKGDDANVTVILAGGGEVLGEIINAKVIRE
jgi:DUF4097 and DUF4098 domain-containing protein YvlB